MKFRAIRYTQLPSISFPSLSQEDRGTTEIPLNISATPGLKANEAVLTNYTILVSIFQYLALVINSFPIVITF